MIHFLFFLEKLQLKNYFNTLIAVYYSIIMYKSDKEFHLFLKAFLKHKPFSSTELTLVNDIPMIAIKNITFRIIFIFYNTNYFKKMN